MITAMQSLDERRRAINRDPDDKRAIYDELGVNSPITPTDESTSAREAVYLGFVSEGRLVAQRHAVCLTTIVDLAA